jgi:hypothetical protein
MRGATAVRLPPDAPSLPRRLSVVTARSYPSVTRHSAKTVIRSTLVLVEDPRFPGCRIRSRAVAIFRMLDEKGRGT